MKTRPPGFAAQERFIAKTVQTFLNGGRMTNLTVSTESATVIMERKPPPRSQVQAIGFAASCDYDEDDECGEDDEDGTEQDTTKFYPRYGKGAKRND